MEMTVKSFIFTALALFVAISLSTTTAFAKEMSLIGRIDAKGQLVTDQGLKYSVVRNNMGKTLVAKEDVGEWVHVWGDAEKAKGHERITVSNYYAWGPW